LNHKNKFSKFISLIRVSGQGVEQNMWHLTKLALRNRAVTLVAALILAGISIWALIGLKVELIPNIEFPYMTVVTVYPNATPDQVVQDVTVPVEKMIWDKWSTKGLKHITSKSVSNMSLIMVEFEYGTKMTEVNDSINSGVSGLSLPPAVTGYAGASGMVKSNPQVIPINLDILPMMSLSLSGDLSTAELKEIADKQIVPELEGVAGVLRVDAEGGQPDQVIISPDPEKMNTYGVSMFQMAGLLANASGSLQDVANTPLGAGNIKLSDVAMVSQGPSPMATISRINGKPSIGLSITKSGEANTVEVAKAVAEKVKALQSQLGKNIEIITVYDQSTYITNSVNQLWEKAIVGGILAIAIVFLFLWAVRASLVTAISIPLSILLGFLGMRAAGITINLLTLSAMSIAVGRLIDDSIVMVEVIFRRRKQGENFKDAAIGGAKEVANPITTATLATVAIFIPLMFVGGIVGQLFIPFALTVTFAMIASLLVALLVVPALSKWLVSGKAKIEAVRDNWYQKIYTRAINWTLLHRVTVIVIAIALFAGSLGLIPVVGTSFMAGMSDKILTVDIRLPANTDMAATGAKAAEVEALLKGNKEIKNYYTSLGTGTSMQGMMSAISGGGNNTASISVYLQADADMNKEIETLNLSCQKIAGNAEIKVTSMESGSSMGMSTSSINLSVQGTNREDVARVTQQLMEKLKTVEGLTDLSSDLTVVIPKLDIGVDQAKVMTSGLPAAQMPQLQQEFYFLMVGGTIPGKTTVIDGNPTSIYIKGITSQLTSVEQAQKIQIGFPQKVALGDIANIRIQEIPSHVSHTDTSLSASVTGSITVKNVGAVNKTIQKQIDALPDHPGVEIKAAGIAEQMGDTFSRFGIAIIIAVVIVFLIVILMMRSFLNPLIIMVSLPLAIIGALIGLAVSGHTLSVSAMMGILMLIGIVLTNAIVLIALVESLRRSGKSVHDSLLEGGKTRLRPILMTALCTIIAMIPMAIGWGSGAMLTTELAIVVIGGLFSSTVLTLIVVPAIYSLVHDRRRKTV
jgi:hydrophobic/amphiphilic exporter-1 (mainly G- bacteria), HAE1 family